VIKRLRFLPAPVDPSPSAVRVTVSEVLGPAPWRWVVTEWFEADPPPVDGDVVVADEVVLRGADWLEARWSAGGGRYKHLALAVRAPGLSPEVFSTRWQAHAGTAGGTPIPDEAKGRAYAQNHPRPPGAWPYDAVNEVWFDDLAGLRARITWFADNGVGQPDDLFGATTFLAVIERVL
jgi:hypothetical protein